MLLKRLIVSGILSLFFISGMVLAVGKEKARIIEIKTEVINGAVHWVPESISVKPGEQVQFEVKHEIEGGFDFHGFSIKELGIQEQINRKITRKINVTVPATLKEGTYAVSCHFHPAHKPAKLDVKTKK